MEILDIYDENKIKTGKTAKRGEKLGKGEYRFAVHVCIFNSDGKMLIQQRAKNKDGWSSMWDITAGGSVLSGETSSEAIERELFEELGIRHSFKNIRPHMTYSFSEGYNDIYIIKEDIDLGSLKLQPEEVEAVKWADAEEIVSMIDNGEFIPCYKNLIRLLFDSRHKYGMHPYKETKIILVRHGQSIGNLKEIYLGHTDWDLSEEGYRQAEECAENIKDLKIDAIYSSPLIRAMHTAEPHAKRRGLPVNIDKDLIEINIGDWECTPVKVLKTYPDFIEGWCKNFGTFKTPNGESIPEAAERMYNAVLRIAKENQGKTVLVTAHAAVIRSFYGKVAGVSQNELANAIPFPLNTSLTTVIFDGDKLRAVSYSKPSSETKY